MKKQIQMSWSKPTKNFTSKQRNPTVIKSVITPRQTPPKPILTVKQKQMPKGYKKNYTEYKKRTPLPTFPKTTILPRPTSPVYLPPRLYGAVKASPVGIVPPGIEKYSKAEAQAGIARTREARARAQEGMARVQAGIATRRRAKGY